MDERNRKLNIFNASDCCSNRHSSQRRNSQNLNESPIEREIDIQNSQLMDNIDDVEIYRLISEDRNDQLNDQPRLPNANLSDNVVNRITSNLIELNENSSHLVLHDTVNISNNNIVNSVRDLLNEHQQVIQRQNAELLENMTQTARAIGNNANAVNNVVTEEINNRAGFWSTSPWILGLGVVAGICAFFYFKNRYSTPENANNNFSLSLNEVILQLQQLRISTLNLTNQFSNLNARQDLPSNPEIRNNGIDPNSWTSRFFISTWIMGFSNYFFRFLKYLRK